ncbi:MAG: DUF1214 domain-containing protein [Hyphomicrobiales bacterium]
MNQQFNAADIINSYVYLLARYLVLRQEHADFEEEAIGYNTIKFNPVGGADFVNPNLDVAYLEAWVAVDETTPAILTIPKIEGRYYTAQILDEWGEVITNINERTYPQHPHGDFALCAPDAIASAPDGTVPVELNSKKAKLLARVELKDDWDGAVDLQKQFKLQGTGPLTVEPPVEIEMFDNTTLAGANIFSSVDKILASAPDKNPGASELSAQAREIAAYMAQVPQARREIEEIIEKQAVPKFLKFAVTEAGSFKNNWLATLKAGNYGDDYWTRAAANLVGIWANNSREVIYFVGTRDSDGNSLDGNQTYRMHFAADQRPDAVVDGYWSIILVSLPDYRVVPNPDDRFNLNSYSSLVENDDGSLDLFFSTDHTAAEHVPNWLPTPDNSCFSLTLRTYVPKEAVKQGDWFPPPLERM